jgi:L-ascorbate metabolism protein UlaG (beta-lactamase superfamily)
VLKEQEVRDPLTARQRRVSDHFNGERFFNPHASTDRTVGDLLKWQRTRESVPWPTHVALASYPAPPLTVPVGRVATTFIGHATFLLRTARAVLLTDPVFTEYAGPFGRLGPRRVRPPAIPLEHLPEANVILISHNHYDHLQPTSLRALNRRGKPVFVAPLGLGSYLRGLGLPRVIELDWWQSASAGDAHVTAVPAQHFSARTPFDRNRTLWCGFIVRSDETLMYFTGDSGYSPDFRAIGERYPGIDVALLPIGAYEPRWFMRPLHMNPAEAVRAHQDLGARVSIAMHFGTFRLTDEGIDDPVRALQEARTEAGVGVAEFRVLDFGESGVF